jgi:hypothetical protein
MINFVPCRFAENTPAFRPKPSQGAAILSQGR